MMIQGKTIPAVADAKVTIDRENKTSLKDRQPRVVMTDANGYFKYGPVDIDTYQVEIAKDYYIFTKASQDSFDFKALREARLEV